VNEEGAAPISTAPASRRPPRRRLLLERIAGVGASAQAAIPGLYAWAITVAPAAWSRGAPLLAQVASLIGVFALVSAPLVEGAGPAVSPVEAPIDPNAGPPSARSGAPAKRTSLVRTILSWTGPTWARAWSVWGFVLSSAIVWALAPSALSAARLDGVRGALGMVGWALFAFASAGPALRPDPDAAGRIVASTSLKPRSELPRGDGLYVTVGVVIALSMQAVGWGIPVPERAVLVRLVTVVCGIAVLGGTTSLALARHSSRAPASKGRLRRAMPWLVMLVLFVISGVVLGVAR
jgi:hypothetical protein